MPKAFIVLLILLPFSCLGQFSISGKILNQATKMPLADAAVFINNTTAGSTSANDGRFKLSNVKSGKYILIVSLVGFETVKEPFLVDDGNVELGNIYLSPKNIALKEVVIKTDPNRSLYLRMFKEQFIGNSELAQYCKILNPEVIDVDFDENTKTLTASSTDFIQINNPSLGYKIKYKLDNFVFTENAIAPVIQYKGSTIFEELKGTPSEERRWLRARQEVYKNSPMHFYRALIADRVNEEGFRIQHYIKFPNPNRPSDSLINAKIEFYRARNDDHEAHKLWQYWIKQKDVQRFYTELRPYALKRQDILSTTDKPGIYAIGCDSDRLYITYSESHHFDKNARVQHIYNPQNTEATLITFNSIFAFLDRNGVLTDPYDLFYTGVWTKLRVAELLPINYDGLQNEGMPADSTISKEIFTRLESYSTDHVLEKAYLHLDRPYYIAGDTIYFKAYITLGAMHELSALSGVLHVELIDNADSKIKQTENLEITNGVAWGDFALPDSLPKGNYRIRAYTQLMRNDDGQMGFFEKNLPVGPSSVSKIPNKTLLNNLTTVAKPDLQVFPEGGKLITGVRSKIAFKAIGNNGLGIKVKGEVFDNENKQVCSFTSVHLGMGYFYIIPEKNKTYHAKVTYSNDVQDLITLPPADDNGIVLSVINDSSLVAKLQITAGKTFYENNKGKAFLMTIYSGGKLTSINCKLDSMVIPVYIFKRKLHSGITRVTLFAQNGEPLSERLLFIQNYDQLKLNIASDKATYNKREKVNIHLISTNYRNQPVNGDFSIAVTNESKLPVDTNMESTILNNLLLTSELKGYVEQPNYYFEDESFTAFDNLDLLMLTQGYRGFQWRQVLNDTPSRVKYQVEKLLSLAGKIKTLSGKPVPNSDVMLGSIKHQIARDTTADANGNFQFNELSFPDTATLFLRPGKYKNRKVEINVPDYPAVTNSGRADAGDKISSGIDSSMKKQMDERRGNMKTGISLKQVDVKSKKSVSPAPQLTHSSNLNGPGEADQVIMGDKLVGCANLIDCLVGLIRGGVRYSGNPPVIYSLRTPVELRGSTKPMAVILDGVVTDQSALTLISYTDVSSIEILKSSQYLAVYGSQASGGAIVINTKRGDEAISSVSVEPGLTLYTFRGFYKAREFYSPKYTPSAQVNAKSDLRTTIFWKPVSITDKYGNASFDFYNSDGTGSYRVVVEGIDQDGNIGRQVYHYKVE